MAKYPGITPFGSVDEGVLMQCSLASEAEVIASGGTVIGVAGVDTLFHSEYGVRASEGVASGLHFFNIPGYETLDYAGQMSFEVESDFLCMSDPSLTGEAGFVKDGTVNYLLSWNAIVGSPFGYLRQDLDTLHTRYHNLDVLSPARFARSGKSQFTTLTLSWSGFTTALYVDGKLIDSYFTTANRANNHAEAFKRLSLLNYSSASGSVESQTYMRNIIVSNRPVVIPSHPDLVNIGFFGHSFVVTYGESTNSDQIGDSGLISNVEQEFANRGLRIGYTTGGVAGGSTMDTGANPLDVHVTSFMANSPNFIVFITGANDVNATAIYDELTYETDLKDMITTMMSGTGVKRMVLANVPTVKTLIASNTPVHVANVSSANSVHNSIPNWWAATKAVDDGDVVVSDYFGLTGGEDPFPYMFRGQFETAANNLHPGPKGHAVMGKDIASLILRKLE